MSIEIDHIILFTRDPHRDAEALREIGLIEGTPNTHPGQGTACRRFFFRNAYLELLYLVDESEARSALTAPTRLWERCCAARGTCPFGIALRPGASGGEVPFPGWGWEYRPQYLPSSSCIHVGHNADCLDEALLIFLPYARRPDQYAQDRIQPMQHAAGIREVTRVSLAGPWSGEGSDPMNSLGHAGVAVFHADDYVLDIEFDGGGRFRSHDLRPQMPLALSLGADNGIG